MANPISEPDDGVSRLTFHRPDKLDAIDHALVDTLCSALDDADADPRGRAVILTGAGDRAFSAGADIAERPPARLARHAPAAVAACLRSATRGLHVSIDEGLAIETLQFGAMVSTHVHEGIATLLTRRRDAVEGACVR